MNIKQTVAAMTLEEKAAFLTGRNDWQTQPFERLGIDSITVSDGPHGLRVVDKDKVTLKAVCYPTASAMAATWNTELVRQVGSALGQECRAVGVDILLGPGTNIKRTPLCGRNFEYYSEDPLLAGELAAAYIAGVQSTGTGTSLKHFAANNQEYERYNVSSEVDMRTLREIYLKPFEIAVKKAQPWTVMCAYNRVNGVHCSQNRQLLDDILRREWGFEGVVISDWGAVHDRIEALKASLELEMPYSAKSAAELIAAVKDGRLLETELDAAAERLLELVLRAVESRTKTSFEASAHHSLTKAAAEEAITLLKNEADILPINKKTVKKLAVIGAYAQFPVIQGGGSAHVQPLQVDEPLGKLKELAGDITVDYVPAYMPANGRAADTVRAGQAAAAADMAIVFVGNRPGTEEEFFDRESIKLSPDMEALILRTAAHNPNTVVVVQAGAAVDMSAWVDKVKAVLFAWYTGQAAGGALAEILFGRVCPSGKTAETFPLCIQDTPSFETYPGDGRTQWYKEGLLVGYRHYDTAHKEVLFPFGHGLSYTSFEYSGLKITQCDRTVKVDFTLKNTGSMPGKETVQLYVRERFPVVIRPDKELKAFGKYELQPGEKTQVTFILDREAFAYYSTVRTNWHVQGGEYEILIGASSRDIRLKDKITRAEEVL